MRRRREFRVTYRRSSNERGVSATFARRGDAEQLAAEWPELVGLRLESRLVGERWEVAT